MKLINKKKLIKKVLRIYNSYQKVSNFANNMKISDSLANDSVKDTSYAGPPDGKEYLCKICVIGDVGTGWRKTRTAFF